MKRNCSFLFVSTIAGFCIRDGSCFDPSDFLVIGLDEIEPAFKEFNGTMYSGLLPIDIDLDDREPRGKLSFWLFNPDESKDSLTIWLNGGPGCSSYSAGLVMECGPVTYPHHPAGHGRTSADEPLLPNDYSWTKATNVLFVEQPTGVGFSFGPQVESEADLSADFYNFLVNFFATFQDMNDKSLYLVGESYAGMYVPSIAHYIHNQNKKGMKKMNLSGIAIGNGWVDAMTQGPAVIDYAYWHGMIDSTTKESLWRAWRRCEKKMHMEEPFHDFTTPDECAIVENVLNAAGANIFPKNDNYAPNQYDITTWDNYPILNTPVTAATTFFNDPEVKKKLHFETAKTQWESCIPGAGRRRLKEELLPGQLLLMHDQPESVAPYIAELLDDAGIRVLIYGGDRDLSVNLQGSEEVLNDMAWSGKGDWKSSDRYLWMVDGDVAGYVKTHKNLDMLLVMNSGHLVPYNVPIPALDLINRLVGNLSYGDFVLPKIEVSEKHSEIDSAALDSENSWNIQVYALTVFIAISCFAMGVFVGSSRKSSQYQKIPDVL